MPCAADPAKFPVDQSGYATMMSHNTLSKISSSRMGSIFKGRMIPNPASVANAVHTLQATASVGSHGP
jgi:hypothetical protein